MALTRSFPSGIRNYSTAINENKASPAFNHLWDASSTYRTPAGAIITGSWRPLLPSDMAAEINVSGGLSVTIGAVAITGNPSVQVSNPVTLGGGFAGITGTVNTNISNPVLATSGVVRISNLVSTTSIVTGVTNITGVVSLFPNSTLNVSNTGISSITGTVIANYYGSTSVNNYIPSGVNGTLLAANPARRQWFIQNLATGGLYVKLGASASDTSFNYFLKGSPSLAAAEGASVMDDGARWRGAVSAFSLSTPNYIVWELT
jgi:hypothetical protein